MNLSDLFIGSNANHGVTELTGVVKESGKHEARSFTIAGKPSDEEWDIHFNGGWPSIGIIPLMDDGRSIQFAALDIDVYQENDFAAIEKKMAAKSIPGILTKSKSGGVHVWFFFAKQVFAKPIIAKLAQIAAYLGYGSAERFPPTGERLKEHDVGYWINIPFHGKERQAFINGKEAGFDEFCKAVEKHRIEDLSKFLSLDTGLKADSIFADGPPCLQRLDQDGLCEGTRNVALFQFGLYFLQKYGVAFQSELIKYNRTLSDPLPSVEIQRIGDSIQTKESYHYSCNKEPLCSRCDRKTCVSRPYGIGKMAGVPLQGVTIGDITQLLTDPAIILIDLNEKRIQLRQGFDTLTSQTAMRKLCLEHIDLYPPKVSAAKWDDFISEIGPRINKVDVPEDSTPKGRFKEHLKDFITKRQSPNKELLVSGGVLVNKSGTYSLRLLDLIQYLKREGFVMTEGEIVAILRSMGAESQRDSVRGRDVNVWIVDPGTIQTDEYTVGSFEEPF
jgi:hypothetical protein